MERNINSNKSIMPFVDIFSSKPTNDFYEGTYKTIEDRIQLPNNFSEIKLFALLILKFEFPNGPMTLSVGNRYGNPDLPVKWDFLFIPHNELRLHIVRGISGIEIWCYGEKTTKKTIIDYINYNLKLHRQAIKEKTKEFEKYKLIKNPYAQHNNILNMLKSSLQNITITLPEYPSINKRTSHYKQYIKKLEKFLVDSEQQASLSILIVIESAFVAESFINMLLAILIKPEIKKQQNINRIFHKKRHEKLKEFHKLCRCIRSEIDLDDPALKNSEKMFRLRNSIAHSYPDIEKLKTGDMWFYRNFPILNNAENFNLFSTSQNNKNPSIKDALFCYNASTEFRKVLSEYLEQKYKNNILTAINSNPIGYNETKDIYSVPFGDKVIVYSSGV